MKQEVDEEQKKNREALEKEREVLRKAEEMSICGVCRLYEKEEDLINIKDHTHTACESCKQPYHTECIKEWMKVSNTCPQCRKTGTFGALSNRAAAALNDKKNALDAVSDAIDAVKQLFFISAVVVGEEKESSCSLFGTISERFAKISKSFGAIEDNPLAISAKALAKSVSTLAESAPPPASLTKSVPALAESALPASLAKSVPALAKSVPALAKSAATLAKSATPLVILAPSLEIATTATDAKKEKKD
ncbi:hypothetical protein AGMMS49936_11110 [Endomicrobiia bacterium]|nr:hypothetical protein AGMMS49936_11110 [Endomicrobiia bacterium]